MKDAQRSRSRASLAVIFGIELLLALFCVAVVWKLAHTPRPPLESQRGVETRLVWMDQSGAVTHSLDLPGRYILPRIVPNTDKVLLTRAIPGDVETWSLSVSTEKLARLTPHDHKGRTAFAVPSPNGSDFAFSKWHKNFGHPDWASFNASLPHPALRDASLLKYSSITPEDWASDGRTILLARTNTTETDLLIARVDNGAFYPLLKLPQKTHAFDARFSPDGKWIAFTSDMSGRDEIYVAPVPARLETLPLRSANLIRVSSGGGCSPEWGNKGEVIYIRPGGSLVATNWTEFSQATQGVHVILDLSRLGASGFSYRFGGYDVDRAHSLILFALDNVDSSRMIGR